MNFKALILGASFGLALAVVPSCGGTAKCGPTNCAGCCDSTGTCIEKANLTNAKCGAQGITCNNCGSAVCNMTTFSCSASNTGGGTASTGGGAGSTGGGTATTCTLEGQECGAGKACMVAELTQTGVRTQCFDGACDLVTQNCGANLRCDYAAPTPQGTPERSCVANGTATKGQVCNQSVQCSAGLTCVGVQLTDGGTSQQCEKYCYKNSDCLSTEICSGPITITGSAEIPLTCAPKPPTCDPLVQTSCTTAGDGCYSTSEGNLCLPAGTTAFGGACTTVNGCVAGASCIGVQMQDGGTAQQCLKACNLDGGMPNCTNASCRPTTGPTGVCL